ncbi:MAG: Methyltransferase type 11 [Betaproteobacteria bacterium]|nr:Methyltransferase type 11 [Betaproteobacteria bacterium]
MSSGAAVADKDAIPFGEYSAIYDLVYRDKDYAAEAGFVAGLIEQYSPRKGAGARVIDLACGTGRHAFELAGKRYAVEGSDISSGMVGVARESAAARGLDLRFHEHSFQAADAIGGKFDVALAMFASLGYLTDFSDFARAMRNAAGLLGPGGIFIFDVWNGAAVLPGYSPHKVRRMGDALRQVERVSRTSVDALREQATVRFEFEVTYTDGAITRFTEDHHVRFYFAQEMTDLLAALGFEVLLRCPFLEPGRALEASDWNMTFVIRRATS